MSDATLQISRPSQSESIVLSTLTLGVGIVAVAMVSLGRASGLEGIAFVTGAIAVWLVVKENTWNFPIGLINTATFAVVFFKARLFGDAALQVAYFILVLNGWYLWLYGGERHTRLHVTRAGSRELAALAVVVVASTLVMWRTLSLIGGSASFWDAATTSTSLGAQWLSNRKRLENWHVWIGVDIVYVPLYLARGLHLTALLCAVFVLMAVMGLLHWRKVLDAGAPGVCSRVS